MNKINITDKDYTYNGMGYNDFNFINNVVPRISQWLINEFLPLKIHILLNVKKSLLVS